MKTTLPLLTLSLLLVAGCPTDPAGRDITLDDPGRLCVVPESETPTFDFDPTTMRSYMTGGRIKAVVDLSVCLSSSCDVDRSATCEITAMGTGVTVTATVGWTRTGADACTLDCGRPRPACTSAPLPAGTYTLRYAGKSTMFDVPSTRDAPCIGDPMDNVQ